jgi:hypothetical protein
MPLKLNVGLSRKVGEANFSSRGGNINVEVEVDSSLAREPDKLHGHVRQLFGLVRSALAEELNGGNGHAAPANGPPTNGPDQGNVRNGNGSPRPATQSQVKAIHAICRSQRLDVAAMLKARFHVGRTEDLSIKEASNLIDDLKRTGS